MARFAIGDVQGCATELRALLGAIGFSADRDQLWFVGDLVNRGPQSLECLRLIRALGDNAVVVLGNHDLHLLAMVFGAHLQDKPGDTLHEILRAPDRVALLQWLLERPLAYQDPLHGELLVHAGVVPQWSVSQTLALAQEVRTALLTAPEQFFDHMYGDKPDQWSETLRGADRIRFIVNCLTRLRVCTAEGRVALKVKGPPLPASALLPWFEIPGRASRDTRIIFGHWSALGYVNAHGVIGLDTGCVWGGALTAVNLDQVIRPISIPCHGYQQPGDL
ncbi:MAG TPA: symmetrical bis(5'-nucleosyl)-tetraphosphatase [Steroidobacteraceae bacterium]|jgi:bis(5'-nucleosyl)-tetraphosphatase (symmetrical)|nr:symmetrical bis(5'-nucleosyl)-tetraphosphatase [Steroidobacteraceae bacterium]